jgi:hypothetical protein
MTATYASPTGAEDPAALITSQLAAYRQGLDAITKAEARRDAAPVAPSTTHQRAHIGMK